MWPLGLTLAITLTLNFQSQIWICYISVKNGPIAMKRKANIGWTQGLKCERQLWPWKVRGKVDGWMDSDRGDFRCRCAVDLSYFLHKLHTIDIP